MFDQLFNVFPGIATLFIQEPVVSIARIGLIGLGFALAYLGFKRTLEPLVMVPMGLGMMAVNAGVMILEGGRIGTLIISPLVSEPGPLMDMLQLNFMQPIYNFGFVNALVPCLLFVGMGTMADISFILSRPWASMTVAILAELGTFATLIIGYYFGLTPGEAAAVGSIGGADGPMVLFAALIMAQDMFVPISIVAYLYLSLCYAGYPYLVRWMVGEKYRGIEVDYDFPDVSNKAKFIFSIVVATLLCLLLPVATPLILSFFLGVAIKEAEIEAYQKLLENTVVYSCSLILGLILGVLCEASTLLDPRVLIILFLGITALAISAVGGLGGGWLVWWLTKGNYNPAIGVAGVSCMPSCAKVAQKEVFRVNPHSVVMPLAMGATLCGTIVSAVAVGIFASTINLVQ